MIIIIIIIIIIMKINWHHVKVRPKRSFYLNGLIMDILCYFVKRLRDQKVTKYLIIGNGCLC